MSVLSLPSTPPQTQYLKHFEYVGYGNCCRISETGGKNTDSLSLQSILFKAFLPMRFPKSVQTIIQDCLAYLISSTELGKRRQPLFGFVDVFELKSPSTVECFNAMVVDCQRTGILGPRLLYSGVRS